MIYVARSGAGMLIVGLVCLAVGGWRAYDTHRFLSRSVHATGSVTEDDASPMLVEVRGPDGRVGRRIPVRISWWTAPWRHLRGAEIGVVFDPRGDYGSPTSGDCGRVDSWLQLWGGTAFWFGLGGLIVAAFAWSRRANVEVSLSAYASAEAPDKKE